MSDTSEILEQAARWREAGAGVALATVVAASDARTLATDVCSAASAAPLACAHPAASTAGRANSTARYASASRCLTAWKLPTGTPNCRRLAT